MRWNLRKTAPAALQFLAVLFAPSSSLRLVGTILRKSFLAVLTHRWLKRPHRSHALRERFGA